MDKKEKQGKIYRPGTRRLVQLYAALLYNANLKGFIDGHIYTGSLKAACVPGLNCYSCPGAVASCPLGSLQNALNSSGHTAPWYIMGILALFGVILGRTICGWICPFGLIQELLHKIPTPKIRKSRITRYLSLLKYAVLAVLVIAIPVWYGVRKGVILPGFCKYICPAGTFEGAVGLLQNPANSSSFSQLGAVFTSKWVIMLVIGLACVFCYRSFCRFLCPLGAIYGFFNRFALTGVKVDQNRCNGCGLCVMKCKMDVKHVGDHECISCGKCISGCAQGAISFRCGKITLKGPETGKNADPEPEIRKRKKAGRIAWGIALAVLAFAVVWFNFIEPAGNREKPAAAELPRAEEKAETGSLTVGTEEGCLLPDFSTELLSGENFRLSEYRGKVVFINFWAITCAPCIEEMPFFEQMKEEHPDVEILAIHHRAGAKKAEEFLKDKGWDRLDFALDSKEKGILPLLNASDAMPQTIVVNRQGVVVYNAQAPLTYEKMEALYREAADGSETEPETTVTATEAPVSGTVKAPPAQAGENTYTVRVVDQTGEPVPGATVAFCTDVACRNSKETDDEGVTTMTISPAEYHINVIFGPDGYDFSGAEAYIGPDSGEAVLTVRKE